MGRFAPTLLAIPTVALILTAATAWSAPLEIAGDSGSVRLRAGQSLLLRSHHDVIRTALVDGGVVELAQTSLRELSLVGRQTGQTQITFWFADRALPPVTYRIEVAPHSKP